MIRFVHRDAKFSKQLKMLRKSGKKGAVAMKKAEKIISDLLKGCPSVHTGVTTKYGECRINKCIKYDLGGGYRLITIKQNTDLFVLYAGTHDECHRWLENNREWRPLFTGRRIRSHTVRKNHLYSSERKSDFTGQEDDPYLRPIDEKMLRMIFSGLYQNDNN